MSEDTNVDPAVRHYGPKPTDPDLPMRKRTHPGAYIAGLIVVLVLGVALLSIGIARLSESTATLEASDDAKSPIEELGPPTTGSIRPQESPLQQDREIIPSNKEGGKKSDSPAIAIPGEADE
jgi:hypothetical protein